MHLQQDGLTNLLAILLIAVHDPLLATFTPLPLPPGTALSLSSHLTPSDPASGHGNSHATSCASPHPDPLLETLRPLVVLVIHVSLANLPNN